jgi:hypothetical protein
VKPWLKMPRSSAAFFPRPLLNWIGFGLRLVASRLAVLAAVNGLAADKKCPDLSGLAIAGREQRDIEAQLCVLPAQRLGFLTRAQREFCRAWPNQSAVTGERGRTLPSGGLAGRGGFSHAKFCHQGASSWSNQRKTRREGRSPLKSGSIVFLDPAW